MASCVPRTFHSPEVREWTYAVRSDRKGCLQWNPDTRKKGHLCPHTEVNVRWPVVPAGVRPTKWNPVCKTEGGLLPSHGTCICWMQLGREEKQNKIRSWSRLFLEGREQLRGWEWLRKHPGWTHERERRNLTRGEYDLVTKPTKRLGKHKGGF